MDTWTRNISGAPLVITKQDAIFRLSVTAIGGPIQVKGNISFQQNNGAAVDSEFIPLLENGTIVLVANPNKGIEFTIDPLAASAAVMLYFN